MCDYHASQHSQRYVLNVCSVQCRMTDVLPQLLGQVAERLNKDTD